MIRVRWRAPWARVPSDPSPRWRGFNLLDQYNLDWANRPFVEDDFAWIAELGFNFVRLPLDYRIWIADGDMFRIAEERLAEVDRGVALGRKYGLHVCLCLHRAPGYTISAEAEPLRLWTDARALEACELHWTTLAARYAAAPADALSMNLLNEPTGVGPETHRRVVERLVSAVRRTDPRRPIVCDGRDIAMVPARELLDLDVIHATRGYRPFRLTHYRAPWVRGSDAWPEPATYPLRTAGHLWDRQTLWRRMYEPWQRLEREGARIVISELGAYNKTRHAVVLPWSRDNLDLFAKAGWGWALWNFRGEFGVLDSGRSDVRYETWRGHKLDRAMLAILQSG